MVSNWILRENLEPFLTTLGWVLGYSFDNDDWAAISEGLLEDNGVVAYEFPGHHAAKLELEYDRSSDSFQVTVEAPEDAHPQVELALAIFQLFSLRRKRV
jgi:hypothetical protein